MAVGLNTGVPWIMCQQSDAPDPVVSSPSLVTIAPVLLRISILLIKFFRWTRNIACLVCVCAHACITMYHKIVNACIPEETSMLRMCIHIYDLCICVYQYVCHIYIHMKIYVSVCKAYPHTHDTYIHMYVFQILTTGFHWWSIW